VIRQESFGWVLLLQFHQVLAHRVVHLRRGGRYLRLYLRAKERCVPRHREDFMAIPYVGLLGARLRSRFHVQVELTRVPGDVRTPATISVDGCIVRIFRGDSSLSIGDRLTFRVSICRSGDRIPPGNTYQLYDEFLRAQYVEAFLNGTPPHYGLAVECMILSAPTQKPQLQASHLAYMLEKLKWAVR
jgi:hypothetical protein